jgi:hypothetical protein
MTPESSFDRYVVRVIEECRVPNVVPYAALYLLAASARSCHCAPPASGDLSSFEDEDESAKHPSAFSHRLSKTFHRSPFTRVRKSHWVGHHLFVGAFLVALRMYWGRINAQAMSDITGFSWDEIEELETAMSNCMAEGTMAAMEGMILKGSFRSLKDVECPHVSMCRIRAQQEEDSRPHCHTHRLRRLFSVRRSRERTASMESQWSMESQFSTSSSVKVPPQPF